ncbi:hypothetical protein F5878DRAFT_629360 [Lentinula raphanica]|uniref:Uncharacterized protein n=1 Tax=Lentinula raphanica TaxID=153919 RepID=A0AA38P251_9AGAR|nr:hypothetical protein C8R42DRAFT_717620 [Lentinula raphanica]KAJ3834905.1 hypothetical protein F5878DRAFT_629360 [Lentinula raphanica]
MSNPDRQNSSSSQEKRSLSEQLSSIGARINRALSTGRGRSTERPAREFDNESLASTTMTMVSAEGAIAERSVSRGRQGPRHSSGRGGIGNIVSSSVPEDVAVEHSSSPIRGRETARPSGLPTGTPFSSSGRGGVGNIRAPSQEQFDSDAITLVPTRSSDTPSFGRSPSQTSPPRNVLSTGRGGIGNIKRNPTSDSNSHRY